MTPTTTGPTISRLPRWIDERHVEHVRVTGEGLAFQVTRPRLSAWPQVATGLRAAGAKLQQLRIADIVEAIDLNINRWCSRDWNERRAARACVVAATGLSEETVDRSFDVELRNYKADSLWRTLQREFGDPAVLDQFVDDTHLTGKTMAIGPSLTCQVMTGNVPGLPALGVVRALLVKSPVVVKVASGEPTFAARFVETLSHVEPLFGDCIVVTYWNRAEKSIQDAALAQADAVVAYGSDEACAVIHAATKPHQRFVAHGHKLSVGLLSTRYLGGENVDELAAKMARDASMFDQHACIAAQAYLVEGTIESVAAFAERVAQAMAHYAAECPAGTLGVEAAAGWRMRGVEAQYRAAQSPSRRAWVENDWTVTVDDTLTVGSGDRMLRIVAVPNLAHAVEMLRPLGDHLQNVAIGAHEDEIVGVAHAVARLGATRLCGPGRMSDPSMTWHHDGRSCLSELVRWCDAEMHPWSDPKAP